MGSRASVCVAIFDPPDRHSDLCEREKRAIQENWRLIYRDLKGNGVELFVRYFSRYPEYKNAFESLKDVRLQDIGKSHKLRAHSIQVMHSLTALIDNLADPDVLASLLMKTGRNHAKRGMTPNQFTTLHAVIVEFLAFKLGHNFGEIHKQAWNKMLQMVMNIIVQGMTAEIDEAKHKETQLATQRLQQSAVAVEPETQKAAKEGEELTDDVNSQ